MADEVATPEPTEAKAPAVKPASKPEEPKFRFERVLDIREGPAILDREWHTIAGAFHELIAEVRQDASKLEGEITRSDAIAKIEEWLKHEEAVDNDNTPVPAGTPEPKVEAA